MICLLICRAKPAPVRRRKFTPPPEPEGGAGACDEEIVLLEEDEDAGECMPSFVHSVWYILVNSERWRNQHQRELTAAGEAAVIVAEQQLAGAVPTRGGAAALATPPLQVIHGAGCFSMISFATVHGQDARL